MLCYTHCPFNPLRLFNNPKHLILVSVALVPDDPDFQESEESDNDQDFLPLIGVGIGRGVPKQLGPRSPGNRGGSASTSGPVSSHFRTSPQVSGRSTGSVAVAEPSPAFAAHTNYSESPKSAQEQQIRPFSEAASSVASRRTPGDRLATFAGLGRAELIRKLRDKQP